MSHRRQQKEALRREREERERKAREEQQRKRLVGFGAAGLLVIAAVAALAMVAFGGNGDDPSGDTSQLLPGGGSVPEQQEFDLPAAARAAGCELRSSRATDRTHTRSLDQRINYATNPPTSGRHYQLPAQDGAYSDAPQDEELVHALEHGRIIVWFKPGLPANQRADLKALFDEDDYQMLLVPRENMPYQVAASAWNRDPEPNGTGRLLVCDRMSPQVYDALRTFRDEHRSNGPEAIP